METGSVAAKQQSSDLHILCLRYVLAHLVQDDLTERIKERDHRGVYASTLFENSVKRWKQVFVSAHFVCVKYLFPVIQWI